MLTPCYKGIDSSQKRLARPVMCQSSKANNKPMHILITGAASGIGRQLAVKGLTLGHTITACDNAPIDMPSDLSSLPQLSTHQLDVRQVEQWREIIDNAWTRCPVDCIINVAGVLRAGVTGALQAKEVSQQFEVNTLGVIYGTDTFARKAIGEKAKGHIINIGSTAGLFATPGNSVYAATKHAIRGFSIAAAGDLRPHGIDVSLVAPTAVKTDMLEQQRGDQRAALTFSGQRALTTAEVVDKIYQEVIPNRTLETFIPNGEKWTAKFSTCFPELFLKQVEKSRQQGVKNFDSKSF